MAFGDASVQPSVNAGLASQPLVTSADPSIVGPAAVENLVNAYRNGFVTNQDILDRVGTVGQAKKKALLESLGEYVNPDVIQSRLSQSRAAGAQANLQTAQAGAQQSLVAPLTTVTANQAALAKYNPSDQEAIQAFGTFNRIPTQADGTTPDYDSILDAGYDYKGAFRKLDIAMKGLSVGQPIVTKDPTTGQAITTYVNGFGQPRTPQLVKMYSDMQREAFDDAYGIRGQRGKDHGADNIPETGVPPDDNGVAPAPASGTGMVSPTAAVAPAAPLPAALVQPATQVAVHPTGAVTIQPPTNPTLAAMSPEMAAASMAAGPAPGMTPPEVQGRLAQLNKDALEDPRAKNWATAQQYIRPFVREATKVSQMSESDQQKASMALDDQGLIENIIKMYDPQGVMREFKWEKLEENQDRLQKYLNLKNVVQRVEGRTVLTPQARQKIINMGYGVINGIESSAQPVFQKAKNQGAMFGIGNPLDSDQDALAAGNFSKNPFESGEAPAVGAAAPAAKGVTIFKTGPYAGVPMKPNGDGTFSPAQ